MRGRSKKQFSSKYRTSMCWISKLLIMLFFFSIVVNKVVVLTPVTPSCLASFPAQNDKSLPLSRNPYLSLYSSLSQELLPWRSWLYGPCSARIYSVFFSTCKAAIDIFGTIIWCWTTFNNALERNPIWKGRLVYFTAFCASCAAQLDFSLNSLLLGRMTAWYRVSQDGLREDN